MNPSLRRAAIACTYCRHRKRRCDGRTPQCRTCREKGLECTYAEPVMQRSDDGPSTDPNSQRFEALEASLKKQSEVIEALKHRLESSVSAISPTSIPDHTRSDYGAPPTSSPGNPFPFSYWAFNHAGAGLSPQTSDETPPLTIPLGHQTSTGNLLVLPQLRSLVGQYPDEFFFKVEDTRSRSAAVRSILDPLGHAEDPSVIDRDSADVYLEQFFLLVYPFHPFLDRDVLVHQYEERMTRGLGLDDQSALLLAIFALGATASDDIERERTRHSGDDLIQQALKILYASWTLSFRGDITLAQGLVLCALYFTYTVEPLMAWRLVHMASTTIQQILARSKDLLSSETNITRLSWVCFIIESDLLAEFHQPRSGIELLVDKMPFPNYGTTPSPENLYTLAEISARSLLNRIHHTLFFTDSLSIYVGRNLDHLSASSPPDLNPDASLLRVCEELDRQLETWYEALPEAIKPDLAGNPGGNGQASLLRLRYWSAKQIIYRPFVIYVTSQRADTNMNVPQSVLEMCQMCLSATRMFLLTAGHLLSLRTPYTYSSAQFAFSCAVVLSLATRSPLLRDFVDDISSLLQLSTELLEPWAQQKTSIKCAFDIICSISTKQQFDN